jgi:hypothetical protein
MIMFALPILLGVFLLPFIAVALVVGAAFQQPSQLSSNRVCNR